MEALGRLFDIGTGWVPVDLDTANGATGKRCSMAGAAAITFVAFVGVAAGGTDDLVLDVQQHTAYTGGTSGDLDVVTQYYVKSEATLDNDETWVKTTQTAASEVTLAGTTYAAKQYIVVIHVTADQLTDGYTHVSLDATLSTSNARLGACLYFLHELRAGRPPALLPNLLNPGAANA